MGCYVIAVGGTGNKVLEGMVYAACADAFYTLDSLGRRKPIPMLTMLSVDVDAACGNTTRAKRAAEYYEQVRKAFDAAPIAHRCFHTRLSLNRWSMNLSRRAASIKQMAQSHGADQLLARALFTSTEANLEYSEGFRGHPDLGVLFFSDLLGSLEEARAQGLPDELNSLIDCMEDDLARGGEVRLLLVGSIFGGTGASGIPALSKYLNARFAASRERFIMGAALMLPYYSVPASGVDTDREIAVDSGEFLDKARTALQYYGMEGMIRDGEEDTRGIFDAAYLLGLPPEHFVSTRVYSTGSQSQENDAHMLEWMAARCAARFFRTGFRGADAAHIDCYYYQCHSPRFGWDSFDGEAALYRARYGALLKSAAVFFSECYPTLRGVFSGSDRRGARVGYVAAYFHRLGRFTASQRTLLSALLEALYHLFAFYTNWLYQVLYTLPPAMRGADGEPGRLPQNALLDASVMDALHGILSANGSGAEAYRACQQAQQGLAKLVKGGAPDRYTMERVISALNGGSAVGSGPEAAFASYLGTLLSAVMDDD